MEILQLLGQKSAVYNQEQFQIKSGLYWRAYGILLKQLNKVNKPEHFQPIKREPSVPIITRLKGQIGPIF